MVGSAKSEQQKLPQQYLPFVLGTTETTLNSSITNNQGHQPLQQPQSLQQPKQAPTKWYDSLISSFDLKGRKISQSVHFGVVVTVELVFLQRFSYNFFIVLVSPQS